MNPPKKQNMVNVKMYRRAVGDALVKLNPVWMARNPVMFVVEIGSVLTTILWIQALCGYGEAKAGFVGAIAFWLWLTVLFANFSEAIAEGRGKAQAETLRGTRKEMNAHRLNKPVYGSKYEVIPSTALRKGDTFIVEAGEIIPSDGEIVQGVALVDESAVTGESAPVIRESGGDRSAITGGTRVLSDWLIAAVTADPGEGFIDRMINLIFCWQPSLSFFSPFVPHCCPSLYIPLK
jgi:K+-transporting ATPase ATPase B chain